MIGVRCYWVSREFATQQDSKHRMGWGKRLLVAFTCYDLWKKWQSYHPCFPEVNPTWSLQDYESAAEFLVWARLPPLSAALAGQLGPPDWSPWVSSSIMLAPSHGGSRVQKREQTHMCFPASAGIKSATLAWVKVSQSHDWSRARWERTAQLLGKWGGHKEAS